MMCVTKDIIDCTVMCSAVFLSLKNSFILIHYIILAVCILSQSFSSDGTGTSILCLF